MANTKISALTAQATLATEDLIAVVDDPSGTPVTKKATVAQLATDVTHSIWNVDNVRIDGNTISTTNADGNLTVSPNGAGIVAATKAVRSTGNPNSTAAGVDRVEIGVATGDSPRVIFEHGANIWTIDNSSGTFRWYKPGTVYLSLSTTNLTTGSGVALQLAGTDAGLARVGAGNIRATDGSTGIGSISAKRVFEAHTAGDTLTANESGSIHGNAGAGGSVTLILPTAAVGMEFYFVVEAAQNLVVDAPAGATIRIAGSASSSGGTATNGTIGGALHIVATSTTTWLAIGTQGTWTLA